MNRLLCMLAAIVLSTSAALAADDDEADEHAGHHPSAEAAEAVDAPGADEHEHAVMSATHLQQNMKMMQELMAKIRETTDPEEKKRLLKAHMLAMQEQIKVMRAMAAMHAGPHHRQHGKGGDMMMKGSMMGEGMMGGGMMMKQHRMMQRRMDAMEQLMEQLIEHEGVESQLEGR